MASRYFELSDGTSKKFWEISVDAKALKVRFGRIGTRGQEQIKRFSSPDEARAEQERLVREKLKKGYVKTRVPKAAATSKPNPTRAPPRKQLTEAQFDREGKGLIKKLVADVKKMRGKVASEAKLWKEAVRGLVELRAAAGVWCPEELMGHILGVDGWAKQRPAFEMLAPTDEERSRWLDYILEAADACAARRSSRRDRSGERVRITE